MEMSDEFKALLKAIAEESFNFKVKVINPEALSSASERASEIVAEAARR